MRALSAFIDQTFYPNHLNNWDDTLLREEILTHIQASFQILDLGAGAGIVGAMNFRGKAARVCGVDLDVRVTANPFLDEGKIADGKEIPYPATAFDLVFADNVLEHLEAPEAVFREIHRVLKPGGVFIFKTPNRFHYVPLIASLTPTWFHKFINSLRGRAKEDSFPTVYRANSKAAIQKLCQKTGFKIQKISLIEGRPEYLRFNVLTYLFGLLYERIVNSHPFFQGTRVVMIGVLERE